MHDFSLAVAPYEETRRMITGESGILRLGILTQDFLFGLCPELLQAGNATHSNKLRPPPVSGAW
jgi:hypothetical protein